MARDRKQEEASGDRMDVLAPKLGKPGGGSTAKTSGQLQPSGPGRDVDYSKATRRSDEVWEPCLYFDITGGVAPASRTEPHEADDAGRVGDIDAVASRGLIGSGVSLPFTDQIQQSFGPHDISGIRAHVGGPAADASNALGAEGYAAGSQVAFRESPSLHLAAHEAAHVVQQRAGVHLKGGGGRNAGDALEAQADRVADLVVAGRSAADALGPVVGGSAASATVQLKAADTSTIASTTGVAAPGSSAAQELSANHIGYGPYECELAGPQQAGACVFSDKDARTRVDTRLVARTSNVATQFQFACNMATVEQMLKKDTSAWGVLAEVLFAGISFGLGAALGKGVKALLKAADQSYIAGVDWASLTDNDRLAAEAFGEARSASITGAVSSVFGIASSAVKIMVKNAAKTTDPEAEAKIEFLAALSDAMPIWADDVCAGAHELDDIELVALVQSLDPEFHTQAHYKALIDQQLARFQSQILDVGKHDSEGSSMRPMVTERRIIRVTDGGSRSRLASVDALRNERWRFRDWIDDSFMDIAQAAAATPAKNEMPYSEHIGSDGIPEVSAFDELLEGRDAAAVQEWLVTAAP